MVDVMSSDANLWHPPVEDLPIRATGRGASVSITQLLDRPQPSTGRAARRRRRALNGLDTNPVSVTGSLLKRHPYYVLAFLGLLVLYALVLSRVHYSVGASLIEEIAQTTEQLAGKAVTISWSQVNEAVLLCLRYAAITAGILILLVIAADRLRPTPMMMKITAFGWGACMAIFVSLILNTWAAELMQVEGTVDPTSGARSAIYSAPFVEEAAKATVLFWLAIILRRRIVSAHQSVVLAALTGIGFAMIENVVYYLRVYMYALSIYQVDAAEELRSIVYLRGLATCFGHPLFTSMTALGMIVALNHRSTIVRILAPLTGYMAAAFGHMLFNGVSSVIDDSRPLIIGGWVAVGILVIFLTIRFVIQLRILRARLSEFVQMGWLKPSDPVNYTKVRTRWAVIWYSIPRGFACWRATLRMQRMMTELGYLREAELRGVVDAMAIERERDLIIAIEEARLVGLDHVDGLPFIPQELKSWVSARIRRFKAFRQDRADRRQARRTARQRRRMKAAEAWPYPQNGAPGSSGVPIGAASGGNLRPY